MAEADGATQAIGTPQQEILRIEKFRPNNSLADVTRLTYKRRII
jgi:hypothetical protein